MCGHPKETEHEVLPPHVTPKSYHLHITPNFDDFTFRGTVKIDIHASSPTESISLNAEEIAFVKVRVEGKMKGWGAVDVDVANIAYDEKTTTATFPLGKLLEGDADLLIEYTGIMNDKLAGFYRSKYTAEDGKVYYLGTTQFEAADARRALPCWDEPARKAVFHITITAPSHMTALSNMHVIDTVPSSDKTTTTYTYAPTPKMSTYLLAWTIGEMDSIRTTVKLPYTPHQDTIVSLYAPKGRSAQGQFALDVSVRVLPLYENFFGHGYNLKKLDLVAIPDFAFGAMENWGLITYRESAVLCDENSSASHRQGVAITVCHEIAHQWFGNLVTMGWWKELWLNESFATYMETWSANKLFPEWDIFTQFVQTEGGSALQLDALRSSHPVEVEIYSASEVSDIFDAISYCKGGSVIRMAIEYIGEEAFQKGISAYIDHFKYANANTVDLWDFLGKAAGKDLAPIMENWTAKQGYPYLAVSGTPGTDDGTMRLSIMQNRFLTTGDVTDDENSTVWSIPLLFSTPKGETPLLVDARTTTATVTTPSWVKVNSRQTAFCRVKYEDALLSSLEVAIRKKALSSLDRLGIVNDYSAFARGGYVSSVQALHLMKHFSEIEDDFSVWSAIADLETSVRRIVATQGDEAIEKYNAFCRSLYSTAMKRVGFVPVAGESHALTQLRGVLFSRMIGAKDPVALAAARDMYMKRDERPIPADLHQAVFVVRVLDGGAEAVEEVKELIASATDSVERSRCLRSLGAACPDVVSVKALFEYCFSDKVRTQDVIYLLIGIASNNKASKEYAVQLMANWDTVVKTLPGMMVGRCAKFVEYGADVQTVKDLSAFWETVSESDKMATGRSFQQGVEGLAVNAKWVERDAKAVVFSL